MIPDFINRNLSEAERAAAWERDRTELLKAAAEMSATCGPWPCVAQKEVDPGTAALIKELEAERKRKTRERLERAGFIKRAEPPQFEEW